MRVNNINASVLKRLDHININRLNVVNNKIKTNIDENMLVKYDKNEIIEFFDYFSEYEEKLNNAYNKGGKISVINFTECYFILKKQITQNSNTNDATTRLAALEKAYEDSVHGKSNDIASQLYLIGFSHSGRVYDEYSKIHNRVDSKTVNIFAYKIILLFKNAKKHYVKYGNLDKLNIDVDRNSNTLAYEDLNIIGDLVKDINNYLNKRYYGIKRDFMLKNDIRAKIKNTQLSDYARELFMHVIDK